MTKNSLIRIRRIYRILLSISVLLAGICLIAGCLSIYFSGDQPYSRQAVTEAFLPIAVPVCICPALAAIGLVLELTLPLGRPKKPSVKADARILDRLLAKKDLSKCDQTLLDAICQERKKRKVHALILTVLLGIAGTVFLVYALNGEHFHQSEINTSMIRAMRVLLPCLTLPFGYAVFTLYYNERSLRREIELVKQVPAADGSKEPEKTPAISAEKHIPVLRAVLLAAGIAALVFGFVSGGAADVLTKAINICTECIGLG